MEIEQENKLSLKFKMPKIDSSAADQEAGGSSSSPANMIVTKRVCTVCNKEFGTSKALSGHMRVHGQAIKKKQRLHDVISTRNHPIFKNPHRNQPRSDSGNSRPADHPVSCTLCSKVFRTLSSLFGHMRCHPERTWRGMNPPRQLRSSTSSEDAAVFDCSQVVPRWPVKARRGRTSLKNNESSDEDDLGGDGDKEEMVLRNAVKDLMSMKGLDFSDSSGLSTLAAAAHNNSTNDVDQRHEEVTNGDSYRGEEFDDVRFVGNGFEQQVGKVDDHYPVMSKMMRSEVGGSSTDHEMRDYIGNAVENHAVDDGTDVMDTELVLGNKYFDGINKDNHGEIVMGNSKNNKGKKMKLMMELNQEKPPAVGGSGSVEAGAAIATDKYKCSTCNKSFFSPQALGGHRSSHNKFKVTVINGTDSATGHKHPPPHQPSSVTAFALPAGQSLARNEEFSVVLAPPVENWLNRGEECATKRNNADEVGGSSKADHISTTVHQCTVCYKIFPSGQALGGHKRCHWTAPADGRTEAQAQPLVQAHEAQPQEQLAVRSSGEEGSTQAGGKRIRLMGFDLNVPASMVVDAQGLRAAGW